VAPTAPARAAAAPAAAPAAERRLVSVLFADLVDFTSSSESRDAEDTREFLTRYFETATTVIERYGGTIEKFIGDAVMAVWGAPVAREDDPERAVRAALELVATVPALDPALRARAGVLTGEAAVTLGAERQGMVAGDLVNTASRIQSTAEPGTVLVGETTKRASEAAVVFAPAGERELKGKAEPVPLYQALRVVANRGGEGRSAGLEAPFAGRERELRLAKELFHASAGEGRAHLVVVSGIAGIGKSRLSWEFEKYVDGLVASVWWHRGRCLAYGEGVAYWALAEMIRGRAGIIEGDDPGDALSKLRATVEQYVIDAEDRAWIEPRLAHLLGLDERTTHRREDLFGAWRLFIERLSETSPIVLVFEDLQWADVGLLDFVEYLLESSYGRPLFVIALTRPELAERRAGFGTRCKGFTSLALEPLAHEAMEELLQGLAPGLTDDVREAILARAEGVPLYAVETVRMLLDAGRLELADGTYRVTGELEELAVPETLHALVASRLDGLSPEERRLVQDASVLGKTFQADALAAVTTSSAQDLGPLLSGLARKEILFLEADPRSPERGQYVFLQDLVRHVAYETLARRDRKSRHVAAARFLEASRTGRDEIVEVIASHYVTALELEPDATDAAELRLQARELLERAGDRAASLGSSAEAARSFARAAELAENGVDEGRLLHLAGNATRAAGESEHARPQLERAVELLEETGNAQAAARAAADLGVLELQEGQIDEGIERMEAALTVLRSDEPDAGVAYLAAQVGRFHFFAGHTDRAAEFLELALAVAEPLRLTHAIAQALITYSMVKVRQGEPEHALALVRHGFQLALEHDYPDALERGYANLGWLEEWHGNVAGAQDLSERAVELTRRMGDRQSEWFALGNVAEGAFELGRWDEIDALAERWSPDVGRRAVGLFKACADVGRHRGDVAAARRALMFVEPLRSSSSVQDRGVTAAVQCAVLMAEGEHAASLEEASGHLADPSFQMFEESITFDAIDAAVAVGRFQLADELLSRLEGRKPGELPVRQVALTRRWRAQVAAATGDNERAEAGFRAATAAFREYGYVFLLAAAQVEQAEWLASIRRGGEAAPLLVEARELFEGLQATPWLERVTAAARTQQPQVPA
jgi:class 3 adenylate cyclase/tetratricopeptide (TPR) repeat protein